jgi:hypothetical protein
MRAIADFFATVPADAWVLFGLAAGGLTVAALWPHVRYAFLKSRFERRLSREGFMLRDEANDRRLAMGAEPEPLNGWQVATASLAGGLTAAMPPWLVHLGHPHLWDTITGAVEGGVILLALWHRLNDPDPKPLWPNAHFPREAIVGFAAALAIVAALLGFMLAFF